MIELLRLELQKVVYFDSVDVDLNRHALTFVRGSNLDSAPASPTSNGAGKSLLFSSIANLLFSSTPLAIKRRSRKEILGSAASSIELTLQAASGETYKITQHPGKYTIYKDGIDLEVKTIPVAESIIKEVFPFSETLFYSTCYLSSQRPFPFQYDSDSQRLEHLVDLFKLDQYELLRDFFSKKLREVKDNEVKLSVLESRRLSLVASLKKSRPGAVDKEERLAASVLEVQTAIRSRERRGQELEVLSQSLNTLLSIELELDELRKSYRHKEPPSSLLPVLKAQKAETRAYDTYLVHLRQYKESRRALLEELRALAIPEYDALELKSRKESSTLKVEKLAASLHDLSVKKSERLKLESARAAVTNRLASLGVSEGEQVDLKEDFQSLLAVCRATIKLASLLECHEGEEVASCPTCLTSLNLASTRTAVRLARAEKSGLEAKLEAQVLYKEYLRLSKSLTDLAYDADLHLKYKELHRRHSEVIRSSVEALAILDKQVSLRRKLETLVRPEPVSVPSMGLSYALLDEQVDLCNAILQKLSAKDSLLQTHTELIGLRKASVIRTRASKAAQDSHNASAALLAQRSKLAELLAELDQYKTARAHTDLLSAELQSVTVHIQALKPSLDRKRVYEALVKAYGAKGLRTLAVASLSRLIEDNLNAYRGLIFAEPFQFTINVSETGMSILVDRGNGKVSDARSLSGAESNCFVLLFLISLLPLLPDDRRTNFLILDEPTSHCDEVTRSIFRDSFLPALREVVPSTFIITPHTDDYLPDSAEWLVVKEGGVSSVVDGSTAD